jgi:hypothetical protein
MDTVRSNWRQLAQRARIHTLQLHRGIHLCTRDIWYVRMALMTRNAFRRSCTTPGASGAGKGAGAGKVLTLSLGTSPKSTT